MNVLYPLTTVTQIQTAPTLMGLSSVLVTLGILEMELFAKVNIKNVHLHAITSTMTIIRTSNID